MKGIEITCEALEGMGFKGGGIGTIYRYEVENQLPVEVYTGQNTTVIEYGEPGWEMDHEVYVKTLPELRKFMRFMFGIKEFPRRELSTITDEECISLASFEWPLEDGYPIRSVVRGDWGFTVHGSASNELTTTALLHVEFDGISTDAQRDNIKDIYASLIDMDFHLPAFHEESHNAN